MDAERQLEMFIDRYSPDVACDARFALAFLAARLPTATRLVYDNYNALAIAFAPSTRASEAIFSIALYPRYVSLFFAHGASLDNRKGLLEGSGSAMRHIKLQPASLIKQPDVIALVEMALEAAPVPLPNEGVGPLIIKSIVSKQMPRR